MISTGLLDTNSDIHAIIRSQVLQTPTTDATRLVPQHTLPLCHHNPPAFPFTLHHLRTTFAHYQYAFTVSICYAHIPFLAFTFAASPSTPKAQPTRLAPQRTSPLYHHNPPAFSFSASPHHPTIPKMPSPYGFPTIKLTLTPLFVEITFTPRPPTPPPPTSKPQACSPWRHLTHAWRSCARRWHFL